MERQARVGRKLQATGNRRCNLSNLHRTSGGYHGKIRGLPTMRWESSPNCGAGVVPGSGAAYRGGRIPGGCTPYSDQANSVVDVRFALERPNITVKLGFEAEK